MRTVVRIVGGLMLTLGLALCLLGLAALPGGGLMFALPYVFLVPGLALALTGGLLLFLTRRAAGRGD